MPGIDLSNLYHLRKNFTIIAVTGRTASGSSTIAKQLAKGFDVDDFPDPSSFKLNHNSYRKYKIVYNFAKVNFKSFQLIKYRDVLTLFILKSGYENFIEYLSSGPLKQSFTNSKLSVIPDYSEEILTLQTLQEKFRLNKERFDGINFENLRGGNNLKTLHDFFFGEDFINFTDKFHDILGSISVIKRRKLLQVISNNLRKSGDPYNYKTTDPLKIFTIVETINGIIKAHREAQTPAKIVIDSLRNPFEIMFFKQRFSAFYVVAINRDDTEREESLKLAHSDCYDDVNKLIKEEYKGAQGNEFYKQHVRDCIEKADIHISFKSNSQTEELNSKRESGEDNTSPYYSWNMQLLKYISLIEHPGIVTPSPEERCMQLAFTAKYNSGCISRQVGAAITDENYSVKAIGWNNTPEGQVPCNLRNAEDLINEAGDLNAFTPYELEDKNFRAALEEQFKLPVLNNTNIQGRNVCFCFKSLKNSYSEGKNQVHTRSLHVEESAFLQITKYGGSDIKNGKLFTTASPCELCSKKAYQLGIKVIYYIDPYPGISEKQILNVGKNPPELRLFNGAIGNSYHWLYEPLMAYKDEISLILGQDIQDLTSKHSSKIKEQEKEIEELNKEREELKLIVAKYEATL